MSRVDLFHSRRGAFHRCLFWTRNERGIADSDSYIHNTTPAGVFYAKEGGAISVENNTLFDSFLLEQNDIMLISDDDLFDLTVNCLVLYDEKIWIVQNLQKQVHMRERQYNKKTAYTYYIQLRGVD